AIGVNPAGNVDFGQRAGGVFRQLGAEVFQRIIPRAAGGVVGRLRGPVKRAELAGVNADVGRLEVDVPVEIRLFAVSGPAGSGRRFLQPRERGPGVQEQSAFRSEALAAGALGGQRVEGGGRGGRAPHREPAAGATAP